MRSDVESAAVTLSPPAPTFPGFPVAAEIRNTVEELATQLQPLCVKVAESTPSTLDFSRELSGAA
ncbi:MAG: hypothetical protein E6H48_14095 [Betaproteobacteria bacterium]|nr:MAG: hypothetical protein E6H48_14095 [Betaproteobacteria bacterium]